MVIAGSRMTAAEFLRLPDDGRKYELVDGEPKEVPAGHEHDALVMHIGLMFQPFARGRGVLAASSAGFRMMSGNIRSPDVSFTLRERLPGGKPARGFADYVPNLCIEIISPSEEQTDMERRVREYFASGAEQVWHLFPETRTAKVFTSPITDVTLGPDDELDGGDLLPGFRCRVAELFELE